MNPFLPESKGLELYQQLVLSPNTLPLVHQSCRYSRAFIQDVFTASGVELLGTSDFRPLMAEAARAGLLLLADAWDEAHLVAQDLDSVEGSYWHGIVHRREPDAGNAKYWFRRVGQHPIFKQLGSDETRQGLSATTAFDQIVKTGLWEPCSFIDLCLECETGQTPELRTELRVLQMKEIQLLLTYCVQNATAR